MVPPGATSGRVTVTMPGGTGTNPARFTVMKDWLAGNWSAKASLGVKMRVKRLNMRMYYYGVHVLQWRYTVGNRVHGQTFAVHWASTYWRPHASANLRVTPTGRNALIVKWIGGDYHWHRAAFHRI